MGFAYDPELARSIPLLPTLDITDVAAARATLRAMADSRPASSRSDGVTIERHGVPSLDRSPDVEVVIFAPAPSAGSLPAVVYCHGGGFVLGDAFSDQALPMQIVAEIGAVVISVDYRLAPECRFPGPVSDCLSALVWTGDNAASLGIDPGRIAVGGVSAGAGLAAAVTLMARDRGGPSICFQLLDTPELDDRLATASMQAFHDTPLWNRTNALHSWRHYLGPEILGGDVPAYAAPARAEDLSGLPPAYIAVCEFDPLRDEGMEYACQLTRAGVQTELHLFPGTFHGSRGAVPDASISRRMRGELLAALDKGLRAPP